MNPIYSAIRFAAISCVLSTAFAQAAAADDALPATSKQQAASPVTSPVRSKATLAAPAQRVKNSTLAAPGQRGKSSPRVSKDDADFLAAANVLGDDELANQRGGADTHLNQNNATGTVAGNVASQLNTGSNTISESAFSNSSGIPIVIQNSGNNVLIQNSTILNLQLTNPK
jgi:hypothetical protein